MTWMRVDEVRRYASGNGPLISRKLIYAAIRSGRLRAARIGAGRNLVTCAEWVDDYLTASAIARDPRTGAAVSTNVARSARGAERCTTRLPEWGGVPSDGNSERKVLSDSTPHEDRS
jgi:hypothetical protein